eukprot:g39107.t1
MAGQGPKNYQLWNHRRILLTRGTFIKCKNAKSEENEERLYADARDAEPILLECDALCKHCLQYQYLAIISHGGKASNDQP